MKLLKNKLFWTILSIITFIVVIIGVMPRPIGMSLDKIGNGQKSVVFVYDPNLAVSNLQTIEMNKARDMIGERATFLIVKAGNPEVESFKNRYDARPASLLFFSGDGKLVDRQEALLNAEQLIERLPDR